MQMTIFKKLLWTTTLSAIALTSAACGNEKSSATETVKAAAETTANAADAVADSVKDTAKATSKDAEAQTSPNTKADTHHAEDGDNSGHDHGDQAAPAVKIDIDHVFTKAPSDHYLGDLKAPNTVIIYASVTCPHCSDWFTTEWDSFKSEQIDTGNTLMVFREIPTPPQQVAAFGFIVAGCAPEDKYMDNVVFQMRNQKSFLDRIYDQKGDEVAKEIADFAGLTSEEGLKSCFANQQPRIDHFNASGARLASTGKVGVPTFIVNGEHYTGDTTAAGLKAKLAE